jgi:hypothetical protein
MSVIGSNILAGASGQGGDYTIARSLRFRSSASAYLNRTPASAGNRQTWTWSGWYKVGSLTTRQTFIDVYIDGSNFLNFGINNSQIYLYESGGATDYGYQTTAVYRDPSAWYHIVLAVDTTQSSASNRVKLYINGVQQTFNQNYGDFAQNYQTLYNTALIHKIGRNTDANIYSDGYLTETYSIDGQALTPSSFGANNAQTGVWQPKKYAGTYGTNGFYLPFTDNSTTTTLGNDFSGNGNNWTTNNISLTAGSTYDSMTDVPTLTSATAANYCVWNPLSSTNSYTLSAANLNTPASDGKVTMATFGVSSGKWYWEITVNNDSSYCPYMGVFNLSSVTSNSVNVVGFSGIGSDLNKPYTASSGTGTSSYGFGTFGFALDLSAGTLAFYKNNSLVYTDTTIPTDGTTLFPRIGSTSGGFHSASANFGQQPFSYTPPTGFVALNTFNLPTPTIGATASTQANKYFDAVLWTGNTTTDGVSQSVPLNFTAGAFWAKKRSTTSNHNIVDVVRGANYVLLPNTTNGEFNQPQFALNTNAVVVTQDSNYGGWNETGQSNVGWAWAANGTGVSNTDGSITSTVSANTSAGFSVVTYTLNNSTFTVGHGLGVAPKMIMVKNRDAGNNWDVYHASLGAGVRLKLNSTDSTNSSTQVWNNTAPTSSVFSGDSAWWTNPSTSKLVAYCFAEVAGYSKIGSWTGNGSTDGTFVYTGFRPRFVMYKRTDAGGDDWVMMDTSRDRGNVATQELYADLSLAEGTASNNIDILSNGFKARRTQSSINASGGNYVYIAFAENPFKYSLAR